MSAHRKTQYGEPPAQPVALPKSIPISLQDGTFSAAAKCAVGCAIVSNSPGTWTNLAIFGPALDFLLSDGDAVFPGARIVFCGVRKELGDRSLPPHVRGILVKREFAPTLEIALSLHPQTKRVAVVAGTSDCRKWICNRQRRE